MKLDAASSCQQHMLLTLPTTQSSGFWYKCHWNYRHNRQLQEYTAPIIHQHHHQTVSSSRDKPHSGSKSLCRKTAWVCCPHYPQGSTFGIPGVEEYAHFLRDVRHAESIRAQLIENIALAGVPGEVCEELEEPTLPTRLQKSAAVLSITNSF